MMTFLNLPSMVKRCRQVLQSSSLIFDASLNEERPNSFRMSFVTRYNWATSFRWPVMQSSQRSSRIFRDPHCNVNIKLPVLTLRTSTSRTSFKYLRKPFNSFGFDASTCSKHLSAIRLKTSCVECWFEEASRGLWASPSNRRLRLPTGIYKERQVTNLKGSLTT